MVSAKPADLTEDARALLSPPGIRPLVQRNSPRRPQSLLLRYTTVLPKRSPRSRYLPPRTATSSLVAVFGTPLQLQSRSRVPEFEPHFPLRRGTVCVHR